MNDLLALLLLLAVVGAALALWSRNPFAWMRSEIALMRADSWANSPLPSDILTTRSDPRCRRMVIRQRREGVRLRREGVMPRVQISTAWTPR